MDYSKTVNLLQTPFPMKADLSKREPLLLEKWEQSRLYDRIQEKQKGKPVFLLHDGPPYANGVIHIGTALNKVLKDIVVKYKTMAGFHCPYKPGWDCHGLPIEHQLFKQLKKQKSEVSRTALRNDATAYALDFVDKQRSDFKRLGVLGEWDHPYLTLSKEYEAAIVEIFFALRKKGFIYRKLKPGYWCATDETALAEAEVEYADKKSDSVFVRFQVKMESLPLALRKQVNILPLPLGERPAEGRVRGTPHPDPSPTRGEGAPSLYVLIWTTTPWTLPANVGLAFHPDERYVIIKRGLEMYIVAEKLQKAVQEKIGGDISVLETGMRGKDFIGLIAQNPIHGHESRAVTAPFVTTEDGTGIVHIAPGHGLEDFEVGLRNKLDVLSPVDERGRFTAQVGHESLQGKSVLKDANEAVKAVLGPNLLYSGSVQHSYPHCWRCKNPVIFRATEQWFMRVDDDLRKKLLHEIDAVRWEPSYGTHRIKGMVEVRPDWCLSRQRHWGAPIAVFYCGACGEILKDDRVDEMLVQLIKTEGTNAWYEKSEMELLKDSKAVCASCGGRQFRKEMDILDVWFDSGVSWHAVVENEFARLKPTTILYLEGSDQHRGWFQTSLIPSVALRGEAPFDVVLTHGFVVDGQGRKMSKSIGNVISPQDMISRFGADIVRLWVGLSDYREDIRISDDIVKHIVDVYRRFRNIWRFLLQNTSDFEFKTVAVPAGEMQEIDRWILSHFEEIKRRVTAAYDKYEFHAVLMELNRFAAVSLSGFYLDALKDWLYCEAVNSPKRRSAQTALYHLARGLTVLLSPLVSFTAEEAYQELRRVSNRQLPESVFLDDLASLGEFSVEPELNKKYDAVLAIRALVNDQLDQKKKAGVLKSSQEALVRIKPSKIDPAYGKILESGKEDWPFLLQMSEVRINGSHVPDEAVNIEKSPHQKCERCWRHRPEVGGDKAHPTLCGRCVGVVGNRA